MVSASPMPLPYRGGHPSPCPGGPAQPSPRVPAQALPSAPPASRCLESLHKPADGEWGELRGVG